MKWLMTHIRLAKLEKELRSNPGKDIDNFKKVVKTSMADHLVNIRNVRQQTEDKHPEIHRLMNIHKQI
jgi:hypothetical protein